MLRDIISDGIRIIFQAEVDPSLESPADSAPGTSECTVTISAYSPSCQDLRAQCVGAPVT